MPSSPLPRLAASLLGKSCNLGAATHRGLITMMLLGLVLCGRHPAAAQDVIGVAKFLAGGAVGLGLHEAGHIIANVSVGAMPGIDDVKFGPVPFFAITHESVSPTRAFVISSAGFWSQHLSSELILARRPDLRQQDAPLLKGVLAFNVLASVAYAGAAFGRVGPLERDTREMAVSARMREPWMGVAVLTPAVLDAARYYHPEVRWLRWASRAMKVAGAVLVLRAVE